MVEQALSQRIQDLGFHKIRRRRGHDRIDPFCCLRTFARQAMNDTTRHIVAGVRVGVQGGPGAIKIARQRHHHRIIGIEERDLGSNRQRLDLLHRFTNPAPIAPPP